MTINAADGRSGPMCFRIMLPFLLLLCILCIQPLYTVAEIPNDVTQEKVDEMLDGMEAAAEAALAERTAGATKYKELVSQLNELMEENKRLEEMEKDLVRRTFAVDDLVRKANAVQLKYVAWQMNLTIEKELAERAAVKEVNQKEPVDVSNALTLEELEQQSQQVQMMDQSEKQLEEWILQVIQDEIASYHAECKGMCSTGKCVTPVEAANLVQESLTTFASDDGVSMVDHARGAKIVHELTSDTYNPPASDPNQLLGNVWWRRYIPQDWERVLPSQWEEWKSGLPSFIKHSFVSFPSITGSIGCCNRTLLDCANHRVLVCFYLSLFAGTKLGDCAARSHFDCSGTSGLVLGHEWPKRASDYSITGSSQCQGSDD